MADYGIALAEFGVKPWEFDKLSPREYFLALEHKSKRVENETLGIVIPICNTIRLSSLKLYNQQCGKRRDQITRPRNFIMFPWEIDEVREPQSLKEMKNVMRMLAMAPVDPRKKTRERKIGPKRKRLKDYAT